MAVRIISRSHPGVLKRTENAVIERCTICLAAHSQCLWTIPALYPPIIHIRDILSIEMIGFHLNNASLKLIDFGRRIMNRMFPKSRPCRFCTFFRLSTYIQEMMNDGFILVLTDQVDIRFVFGYYHMFPVRTVLYENQPRLLPVVGYCINSSLNACVVTTTILGHYSLKW